VINIVILACDMLQTNLLAEYVVFHLQSLILQKSKMRHFTSEGFQ